MAERSTTVNINYKVNTVEITRAEQASQKAQQATDRLRQSTDQLGQTSKKAGDQAVNANRTWGTSIEGLRVKQQQLAATIALTNKDNISQLQKLSAEYRSLSAELKKLEDEYLKLNNAQKSTNESQQKGIEGLGGLINAARTFIGIQLAREIVDAALAMEELAGRAEGVGKAFERQIPNSTSLLVRLRQATKGTVTDLELMQQALKAQNFGISLDALPKLLEFAAIRAQQTGVSVDYLVNSIVNGIGRKSLLILDNLQISASRLKEEFDGAGIASQSVGQVSEAVSRILAEQVQKMGEYAVTTETDVRRLRVSWEELRTEVSKGFAAKGISFSAILGQDVEALRKLVDYWRTGRTFAEQLTEATRAQDVAFSEQLYVTTALNGSREQNIRTLEGETQRLAHLLGEYAKIRASQNENIEQLKQKYEAQKANLLSTNDELLATKESIELQERLRDVNKDDIQFQEDLYRALSRRLETLKQVNEETKEELGLIEKQRELIKTISDEQAKAKTEDEVADLNDELREEQKELDRLLNLSKEQKGLLEELRAREKALNEEQTKARTPAEVKRVNDALDDTRARINDLLNLGKQLNKMFSDIGKNLDNKKIIDGLFPKDASALKGAADKLSKDYVDAIKDGIDLQLRAAANGDFNINVPVSVTPTIPTDAWDKIKDEFIKQKDELISTGIFNLADVISAGFQAEADMYDARLAQLKDFYDQQTILAGDNEKAKDKLRLDEQRKEKQLRLEAFNADKKAKRQTALINGAAAIVNAFATLPYPAAIVASALIAANTASQIAIIDKQVARFAKGGLNIQGPGNSKSDSIPAMISKGESVMTAAETKGSYKILKSVRSGKLNDEVMRDIVTGKSGGHAHVIQTFDDSRIIGELKEIRKNQPDYTTVGNMMYETRTYSDTYKKKTRSKAMGI